MTVSQEISHTLSEGVVRLLDKGVRFLVRADRVQYIPCPHCSDGYLIRHAYDAAECSGCGVQERYTP